MTQGKSNISVGLFAMAAFMAYGFLLIYLRDFAPGKDAWIADYAFGTHFEARLAHVHGNLFAFLNIVIGYLLWQLPVAPATGAWVSRLALVGLLMPLGIVAELVLGAPPVFVLVGAVAMVAAVGLLGVAVARLDRHAVRP
jgi:hypothetical protein